MEKLLLLIRLCQIDYICNKIDYMKNLLILFLLLLAELAYSQTNFSFVDDDMEWAYLYSETEEISSIKVPTILTVRYEYKGDTIINGFIYKKMFKSLNNGRIWLELGYFRQDKNEVFYIKKDSLNERLVYDFSEDIKCPFLQPDRRSLASDSILLNGVKKARWGFYYAEWIRDTDINQLNLEEYCEDIVIEDIGSIICPPFDTLPYTPYGLCGARYYTSLLCVQKGDEVIWHDPDYNDCYYEQTAINTIENQQISISPNPVKDKLTLTLPTNNNKIQIFDIQGKLVLQTECGETASIHVSMLPKGVYSLLVNNSGSQTFIKQ